MLIVANFGAFFLIGHLTPKLDRADFSATSLADAVVRRQIIDDGLGISGADRRPVGLDHFVDFAFPALTIEKSRNYPWIVQRVTGAVFFLTGGGVDSLCLVH
jgi:hypothetical protein